MSRLVLAALTMIVLDSSLTSAATGWYLLSPIIAIDGNTIEESTSAKVLTDQSLSKWKHGGSFDSARECNAQREREWQSSWRNVLSKDKMSRPWLADAFFAQAQAAVCITSDDPRLK